MYHIDWSQKAHFIQREFGIEQLIQLEFTIFV